MEMILLDWTRMGKSYCLAGAVLESKDGNFRLHAGGTLQFDAGWNAAGKAVPLTTGTLLTTMF